MILEDLGLDDLCAVRLYNNSEHLVNDMEVVVLDLKI